MLERSRIIKVQAATQRQERKSERDRFLIERLSRELHDFREETRSGFGRLEEATRRHSTVITAGTFSLGGLTKAMERLEALIHDRDQQIMELRDRVRILEEKQAS